MHPTERANLAQGRFYGGSGRRAEAHTRPALPKVPSAPLAFSLLGAPQAPGNKPDPLKEVKALGDASPEAGGNLQCWGNTRLNRADQNTVDQNEPQTTGEADQTRYTTR